MERDAFLSMSIICSHEAQIFWNNKVGQFCYYKLGQELLQNQASNLYTKCSMYYKVKQFRKIRLENTLHKKVPTSKKSTAFFNHFKEGGGEGV